MKIPLTDDFVNLAREILAANRTLPQWSEIESDDMFRKGAFVGGFDATETEFCFSFEAPDGEFWFQLSLDEIERVSKGELSIVEGRPAKA